MRVGEFGDVKYLRMLVNLERNCYLGTDMLCYYTDNNLTDGLRSGQYGGGGQQYDNILEWAGWQDVGELRGRDSSNTRACGNVVLGWVGLADQLFRVGSGLLLFRGRDSSNTRVLGWGSLVSVAVGCLTATYCACACGNIVPGWVGLDGFKV